MHTKRYERICVQGAFVCCLTNLENHGDLDNTIHYYYVKPRLVYRLLNGKSSNRLRKTIGRVLNKLKLVLSYPTWPLISPLYARRNYCAARAICQENRIDMIIPIYTQIDTLMPQKRLRQTHRAFNTYLIFWIRFWSYGPSVFKRMGHSFVA